MEIAEDASKSRLLDPGQCPPCVLHHNNRTVEKIVQQLFLVGMRRNMSKSKLDDFITRVELVVNRDILRRSNMHIDDRGGWHFSLTDGRKLDDVNLSNGRARIFMQEFHHLVKVCTEGYKDDLLTANWNDACDKFNVVAKWLDSKEHFEFEEVCKFQLDADEFCDAYFLLTGRDGMTNYFHLLKAGHYAYFLRKYHNLYRYSQQGWENINSRLKRTFHHNTQKGGCGRSKLLPVIYTLLRDMLW